jgi:hypothetical protein
MWNVNERWPLRIAGGMLRRLFQLLITKLDSVISFLLCLENEVHQFCYYRRYILQFMYAMFSSLQLN